MTLLRPTSPEARAPSGGRRRRVDCGPALVGAGTAALVTGLVLGALVIELGIAGTATEGRGTLPISAHAVYDRGLALGLFVVAAIFGPDG